MTNRPPALTHFAARAGDHNDRAMQGSRAISDEFASRLGIQPFVVGVPDHPLNARWDVELDAARPALSAMSVRYEDILGAGYVPVTALSRCAVALATLPVVARHHPDAAVIWFDAHADINTPGTTKSGYLGGLALSGPLGLWDSGLGAGLSTTNTILAGTRDIDAPEQRVMGARNITHVTVGPSFGERLTKAVGGRPVYIHIDCDVLEPHIVPTDYRVPGGLSLDELHRALRELAAHRVVGMELGEFEADTTHSRTASGARQIADALMPLLDRINAAS